MASRKKYNPFNRYWNQEDGLSGMLTLLIVMHFIIIPVFGSNSFFIIILNVFWTLFLIAGIFSLSSSIKQAVLISIIPLLFVGFRWISVFNTGYFVLYAELLFTILSLLLLVVLVLKKVFEPGPITIHRVIGSVVVYMLLANLWAVVYLFIHSQLDDSFNITLSTFEMDSLIANFTYFSYITLTSTGFGEITPIHPVARSLVQAEAVIGIMYPIVLIGRLVSDANYYTKE
jgi:uncharacterized membrane protein YqjE